MKRYSLRIFPKWLVFLQRNLDIGDLHKWYGGRSKALQSRAISMIGWYNGNRFLFFFLRILHFGAGYAIIAAPFLGR